MVRDWLIKALVWHPHETVVPDNKLDEMTVLVEPHEQRHSHATLLGIAFGPIY